MAFTIQQIQVFTITFICYALYHSNRKNLSGVKTSILNDWMDGTNSTNETEHRHKPMFEKEYDAEVFLGTLDAVFMVSYAASMFFWGWLGDRSNPKIVVLIGMVGSGITLFLFGFLPYLLIFYSMPYYIVIYVFFGIFQSCGWPNLVAIMAHWFSASNRGFILGIWAANASAGNIIGALLVSAFLFLGYEYTFVFNSLLIFIGALVLLLFVRNEPDEEHFYEETANELSDDENFELQRPDAQSRPITIIEAVLLPNVLIYCLCTACLKLVNYAIFFWLPYYLNYKYQWEESKANQLSAWFDFGGIIGSIAGGIISDRLGHRSIVIQFMLLASILILLGYIDISSKNMGIHAVSMVLLGITIAGPFNLITGVVSIDLGSQPALAENSKAMSTVSGLINGVGSAGAAIGQLLVPLVKSNFGFDKVFVMFIIMNILSILCLAKRFYLDSMDVLQPYLSRSTNVENNEQEPLLNHEEA